MPDSRTDSPRSRRILELVGILVVLAALVIPATWPFVSQYRLHGDDFALALYSSAPYFDISDTHTWFSEGYSRYFLNYPGWPMVGTDFVRPVANLGFFVAGIMAPLVGETAYILGNLSALVATVLLANILISRYFDTTRMIRVFVSLAAGLTPAWYPALTEASFSTNAFSRTFGLAALVVLDARKGVPRGWRLWAVVALQLLALGSHETGIAVSFVCIAMLFAFAPSRPTLRQLLPFGLPLVVLAIERALVTPAGGVYALRAGSLASVAKRAASLVLGPLIPFDFMSVLSAGIGSLSPIATVTYAFAAVANTVFVIALLMALKDRRFTPRLAAVLLALGLSRLPGMLGRMDPRFMGLSMVVAIVVYLFVSEGGRARRWQPLIISVVFISQLGLFASDIFVPRFDYAEEMQHAGEFFDLTQRSIAESSPTKVVLANGNIAYFSARAMLQMAAWPERDIEPIVINSYQGEPDPSASIEITAVADELVVSVALGKDQNLFFAGANPDFELPMNGFDYLNARGDMREERAFVAVGPIDPGSTLVVGVDPRTGEPLPPRIY